MLYPKINSIFKRDKNGKFTSEFSDPNFEYLFENDWYLTEKIDGTNIRIIWDGEKVTFGGRTDRAQIPAHLFNYLNETFTCDKMKYFTQPCILFGEGYGNKIQKVGKEYLPDSVSFALFDIYINGWWLNYEHIFEASKRIDIQCVPFIEISNLENAINLVKNGFQSQIGGCIAEGVIAKPCANIINRNGHMIITKIKHKDFAE